MSVIDELLEKDQLDLYYKTFTIGKNNDCYSFDILDTDRKNEPYKSLQSNRQIQTIIDYSYKKRGMKYFHRLMQLLGKHVKLKHYNKFLHKLLDKKKVTDNQIYKKLHEYAWSQFEKDEKDEKDEKVSFDFIAHKREDCTRNLRQAQQIIWRIGNRFFERVKKLNLKKKAYLDFGCGDCIKTKMIGDGLEFKEDMIYGADIKEWGDYHMSKRVNVPINHILLDKDDKKYPFEDGFFSLVTADMVLHHVKELDVCIKELNRIIEMNGYLYIIEHDASSNMDYMLCDIEHALFEIVDRNNFDFKKNFYAKYYWNNEWSIILDQIGGFKFLKGGPSINVFGEISPTRRSYLIYQKVREVNDENNKKVKTKKVKTKKVKTKKVKTKKINTKKVKTKNVKAKKVKTK